MMAIGVLLLCISVWDRYLNYLKKMDTMMAIGVLLLCISVWDRYLNYRGVQNLSMFILLSL